jgi:hypothetical protein
MGRIFEHLLDPHIDVVPIELEAPFGEGLRPHVMTAARAGGQHQYPDFGHVRNNRNTGP